MAETKDYGNSEALGKLLARIVLVSALGILAWTLMTVHQLSIDIAVMQNQLDRIETYWTKK